MGSVYGCACVEISTYESMPCGIGSEWYDVFELDAGNDVEFGDSIVQAGADHRSIVHPAKLHGDVLVGFDQRC